MKIINLLLATALISLIAATNQAMPQTAAKTYGPIKNGDMLWNIAAIVRPDRSISRYQAMLALLKANPHAFHTPCNLNTLKVGRTLDIPSRADMQALSRAEAVNEFNRQYEQWKTYRKRGQQIVCPQSSVPPVTEPKNLRQPATAQTASVLPSASVLITTAPVTNLPPSRDEVSNPNPNQETTESNRVLNPVQETTKLPLTPSTGDNALLWFSTPLPSSIIIGVLIAVLLFFAFFIGWRLQRYTANQYASQKSRVPDTPVGKMPLSPVSASTSQKPSDKNEPNNGVSPAVSETKTALVSQSNGMKEKLDNVRACLAEDKAHITDKLLREVIQKGTPEQQEEAKQLYEINKKINYMEHNVGHKQPATFPKSNPSTYPIWRDLERKGKHLPTQYLPEDREKVFELIDKIFELLDYELNAQGQLIDAYVNRHQQAFFHEPYEIVEKPEKVILNDKKGEPLEKPRYEPGPPRRL